MRFKNIFYINFLFVVLCSSFAGTVQGCFCCKVDEEAAERQLQEERDRAIAQSMANYFFGQHTSRSVSREPTEEELFDQVIRKHREYSNKARRKNSNYIKRLRKKAKPPITNDESQLTIDYVEDSNLPYFAKNGEEVSIFSNENNMLSKEELASLLDNAEANLPEMFAEADSSIAADTSDSISTSGNEMEVSFQEQVPRNPLAPSSVKRAKSPIRVTWKENVEILDNLRTPSSVNSVHSSSVSPVVANSSRLRQSSSPIQEVPKDNVKIGEPNPLTPPSAKSLHLSPTLLDIVQSSRFNQSSNPIPAMGTDNVKTPPKNPLARSSSSFPQGFAGAPFSAKNPY